MCEVEGKKLRVGGEQPSPPRTTPGKALYGRCVCCTRRSDRRYVMWTKSPSSLDSFPYSTERKEIQRICLHSRNARINWEDCMSVPRVRDSCCFTREVFGGGLFLFASSSFARNDGDPHLPRRVGLVPFPRGGGPPALRRTPGRTGPPWGTHGGGGQLGAGASHPGPGRSSAGSAVEVWAPTRSWAGLAPRRLWRVEGRRGRGEVSIQESASELFLFFFFPPFLKEKAIIYRPFRFAECSLFELDIQTPPEGEGGAGVGEETAGAAGEACTRRRVPGRPRPGRLVTTLCSKDAGRAPLF